MFNVSVKVGLLGMAVALVGCGTEGNAVSPVSEEPSSSSELFVPASSSEESVVESSSSDVVVIQSSSSEVAVIPSSSSELPFSSSSEEVAIPSSSSVTPVRPSSSSMSFREGSEVWDRCFSKYAPALEEAGWNIDTLGTMLVNAGLNTRPKICNDFVLECRMCSGQAPDYYEWLVDDIMAPATEQDKKYISSACEYLAWSFPWYMDHQ